MIFTFTSHEFSVVIFIVVCCTFLEDGEPRVAIERITLFTFEIEDPSRRINVEPASISLFILLEFLRRDRGVLVVVVTDALYISHVDHLLRFLRILLRVTIVEEESLVLEPEIAFLPVGHPEVRRRGFLEDPAGHLEVTVVLLVCGGDHGLLLGDL